jgi:hypothetical protein
MVITLHEVTAQAKNSCLTIKKCQPDCQFIVMSGWQKIADLQFFFSNAYSNILCMQMAMMRE